MREIKTLRYIIRIFILEELFNQSDADRSILIGQCIHYLSRSRIYIRGAILFENITYYCFNHSLKKKKDSRRK